MRITIEDPAGEGQTHGLLGEREVVESGQVTQPLVLFPHGNPRGGCSLSRVEMLHTWIALVNSNMTQTNLRHRYCILISSPFPVVGGNNSVANARILREEGIENY